MPLDIIGMFLLAYLIGSIPFGYIVVKIKSGKDIRTIQSGRTGMTNAMRAAGVGAGLLTVLLDITKGATAVAIARLHPSFQQPWLLIIIPLLVIIGHNYSIFMLSKQVSGKLKIGGGAGGAACLGGSLGLWWPSSIIVLIIGILIYYFVGYASVTTMSIALSSTIIFALRAINIDPSSWAYAAYGFVAEILLVISLRPNIQRLKKGTERLHGFRARKNKSPNH
ncbi:MAG: glycerol-3-phosphate acyltransferase [Anaerolineales bacterium]|jgi:glycerol-3-phosphate acyltransferase PlsY